MATILGIDLGTTNSGVAIWRDGAPQIIPDAEGGPLTPSVVAFDPDTELWLIGHPAREFALTHPRAAVYSIKRFIGRRFGDAVIQEELQHGHILYEIEESRQRRDVIEVALCQRHLTPQEVSAKILQKLKADAEAYLGHEVSEAVITVPAYFHDSQRQATRDAGRIAGLRVRRVFNEPTAACLAFGYQGKNKERHLVAVYDLGGGTFDISLLEVGGRRPFRVRATNGDTHLGGDDLDWLIVDWMLSQIGGAAERKAKEDPVAQARLRAAAEQAKIALSSESAALIHLPGPLSPTVDLHDLDLELTREQFNVLAQAFIDKTLAPCAKALHDARLQAADIQEVLLVGGQTRTPAIHDAVREFFGREPNVSVNPEEVVALGAAVQAAILSREATGLKLADVVPLSLGVETQGQMDVLIGRNTPIPITKVRSYSTAYDNQESVEINIYQGERPMAADNVKLGSFILRGIEPAPKGEPEIAVTFRVDSDSILLVTAEDVNTGNCKEITITDSIRLSDEEIRKMVREAEIDLNGDAITCEGKTDKVVSPESDRYPTITIMPQDVRAQSCDVLILKYAQGYYGADRDIAERLAQSGVDVKDMQPGPDEYSMLSASESITAKQVLFVGVVNLGEFRYDQIRAFAESALDIVNQEMPEARHLAMTIHGVGYGLDEQAAFKAQLAGLVTGIRKQTSPLEKITIVEHNQERASRLQKHLDAYLHDKHDV